jgi:hypothetical protein
MTDERCSEPDGEGIGISTLVEPSFVPKATLKKGAG